MVGAIAGALVLLSAGSLAFALARHATSATAATGHKPPGRAVVQLRERAAAWVTGQVTHHASVACDRVMCRALAAHGFPAGMLVTVRPGTPGPLRSAVLVDTPAVRGMLGRRADADAPVVIAGFGSGGLRVAVRVIATSGAAAYRSALAADVAARSASGSQLLGSGRVAVSATARRQLVSGQVDSRLLVTIAGLAAGQPVSIVAFGDLGPGAAPGVPLRSADLAEPRGSSGAAGIARGRMQAFLHAQRGRYAAGRLRTVRLPSGRPVLRIEFPAPSPLGLLGPGAPAGR